MTRNQKTIVIVLGVFNLICFCILAPLVLLMLNFGSTSQTGALPTLTPVALVRLPTSTATPIPPPEVTYTSVFAPRPTVYHPTVTPRSLDAGWKFIEVTSEGYGVALPPNWDKIDFDPDRLAAMLKSLNDKNPQFASALSSQSEQLIALNVKFFAFDLSSEALSSGFVTNVNILRDSLTFNVPLDTYVQLNVQNLQKAPAVSKTLTHKRVTLASGDAELIQYQLTLTTSQGKTTASTTQYLMIHSGAGYIITFTTRPDKEKTYAPISQKIAQSLQWLP